MACHTNVSRYFVVHQVAINIVLQDEFRRVKPVIEDLTPHDMSSHTPAYLIAFMAQPVVAEYLSVKVMCFKGSVVHVAFGPFEEEESVMVDEGIRSSVNAIEGRDVVARGSMKELEGWRVRFISWWFECRRDTYIAGYQIETGLVELVRLCKICHYHSEMAKFVDRSRSFGTEKCQSSC